jgi:cytochrome P450
MVLPALRRDLGRWSPGGRLRRVRASYRAFVAAEIERRRVGRPGAYGDDLLGRLVALHDGFVDAADRQRLFHRLDALSGALENVCPVLAWCCLHLGRSPEALERARAAVLEGDADGEDGGEYLEAVCLESLRLNPPFVGAMRRVAAPVRIDGVTLRPGTYVLPCQYLTHRRSDLYLEPRRFLPERFLGPRLPPHEYAPFGGGVRRCLGEGLALRQMRVILAELLRAFEFRPMSVWSNVDRRRNGLIFPRDPLLATLSRGTSDARAR